MVLFDEMNHTKLSIALSVLTIFSIFLIDYLEHNLAFGSFHENPIITIGLDSEFLTYDDIITGFSIKYPPDWERAQHLDKSVTFLAPRESNSDTNPAGLGIMVIEVESNKTLASITQNQLNKLKNLYPDIQILESMETIFLGHPSHMIIFTATDNTQSMRKAMQIWFKEDNKAFLMTYKSDNQRYSKYLPTIDKMLNSFYTYKK
ncbi:MAG: PsbP-related protein [Nitrososphaeraceae archaeon]|jgi:eukaryotic-like serine/threonine-protein kinase|nr:PsbP-related protein [Nitrososphaeraceae archaeon]MDW0168995.1 PsbP-related protein [Nitrososphaeraceae archaeon]MDW0173177.1 PsbP-related protein [Nitrososphaeraceae archaeon]MDW0175896.1 PsbP-related protein [Nitrososphaeraceae archaeon]MDW0177469.1 PsbP-related protein [Nitrososphaeraceae archaeon]